MVKISMRDMLKAGVHFGHNKRYWNPKMSQYIFGVRNRIHIINLEKTLPLYIDALNAIGDMAAKRKRVLFVGTKRAAQDIIRKQAERCGMPFVNHRWLGGMLTNYKTVRQSIRRLKDLEADKAAGAFDKMIKKEALGLERELEKLERSLGGIKEMGGLPDALFVIDVDYEDIAIAEARKMGIPVFAVVDTNSNPDNVDYLIPGNDDSRRAIEFYTSNVAQAIIEGRESAGPAPTPKKKALAKTKKVTDKATPKKAKVEDASAKSEQTPAKKATPEKAEQAEQEVTSTAKAPE